MGNKHAIEMKLLEQQTESLQVQNEKLKAKMVRFEEYRTQKFDKLSPIRPQESAPKRE